MLAANAETAVRELGVEATVQPITDMPTILQFDVLMTPALVIDGRVVAVGRLLSAQDIKDLLTASQGK
jgi:hypothetical protein